VYEAPPKGKIQCGRKGKKTCLKRIAESRLSGKRKCSPLPKKAAASPPRGKNIRRGRGGARRTESKKGGRDVPGNELSGRELTAESEEGGGGGPLDVHGGKKAPNGEWSHRQPRIEYFASKEVRGRPELARRRGSR